MVWRLGIGNVEGDVTGGSAANNSGTASPFHPQPLNLQVLLFEEALQRSQSQACRFACEGSKALCIMASTTKRTKLPMTPARS